MFTACIIIPCYNEAERLPVDIFLAYLEAHPHIQFCFVNDGSRDRTREVLDQLVACNPAQAEVLNLTQNGGKAEAVRSGMLHIKDRSIDYVGYFDADLATPLEAIDELQKQLELFPHRDMVMGSRIQFLGTTIQRRAFRHYVGRIIATFISLILNLPVYDTQCGAKLFRSRAISILFAEPFLSPWLFDVEIIARLMQTYGWATVNEKLVEVPLREWIEKSDSRISLSYMFRMPLEMLKIYQTYRS